eukprot:3697279-Rhodomonas_salina.1
MPAETHVVRVPFWLSDVSRTIPVSTHALAVRYWVLSFVILVDCSWTSGADVAYPAARHPA